MTVWVSRELALAIHDEQLAQHGGAIGVRDDGLLEGALGRPLNLASYGQPDLAELAAMYAIGIARNHPFVDGNKRTAAVAMELFLDLNGYELTATDEALVLTILGLADGSSSETDLADWVRGNMRKV